MNNWKIIGKGQIFLFLTTTILILGCKKDLTDEIDITEWKWKLKSVSTTTNHPENKDYLREDAYILVFETDTTFTLNTSVNNTLGFFSIQKKGEIVISNYVEITKVGTSCAEDKNLNKELLIVFNESKSYDVFGKTVTFKGFRGEVEFKRE